jgi:diguanylate cyclase
MHGIAMSGPVRIDGTVATPGSKAGETGTDWTRWLATWRVRLLQTAGQPAARPMPHQGTTDGRLDQLRADLAEFVAALDAGQAALVHELQRTRRLEVEVATARAALAEALVDLAGTRAGERHARHLALHDGLTALPNRRYFRQTLATALARRGQDASLAVLYLDLDGFKPINDAHGHDIGDKLLQIVAARLSRTVRAGDMVSRLGGDEFGCLIADVADRAHLASLASKLFEAVSAPVVIAPLELVVRPSIGIAVAPTDGTTAERLIASADAAMYRAKRAARGCAFAERDAAD